MTARSRRAQGDSGNVVVVIPCYRVRAHVLDVIRRIPAEVVRIICVDDACPEASGQLIAESCTDPRVRVITHATNQGVGGAMITGYRAALEEGADVVIKLDGDGQMDPALIGRFLLPITEGLADYAKGNRFYRHEGLASMPALRLVANAVLSFMAKASTGYWRTFDPTNGYTAIHRVALELLPLEKISRRYFFETDMLFRLGTLRAVVFDVPMDASYGTEISSLSPSRILLPFLAGHVRNLLKRFAYSYLLRDFNIASVLTLMALPMIFGGAAFGALEWARSIRSGIPASSGTVMVATLPIVIGIQALLAALSFDLSNAPVVPLQRLLIGELLRPASTEKEYRELPPDRTRDGVTPFPTTPLAEVERSTRT